MSDNSSQAVYTAPSPLSSFDCAQLWGALVMCIAYGVVVTLCLQCFAMFIKGFRAGRATTLWDRLLIIYVFLMFVVSTIYTGTSMQLIVLCFVGNPNQGGPPPTETAIILNSASPLSLFPLSSSTTPSSSATFAWAARSCRLSEDCVRCVV